MTGYGSEICRHEAASGFNKLRSGPTVASSEVTSSSRMASSGGFVTWANNWVK